MKRYAVVAAAAVTLVLLGMSGCKKANQAAQTPAAQMQQMPSDAISLSGKVTETMNSGGYTYVQIEATPGAKTWVAVPQTKVKVGQVVTSAPGMVMRNFTSNTLHRTFATIVFSGGLR